MISLLNPVTSTMTLNLDALTYLPLFVQKNVYGVNYSIADSARPTSVYSTSSSNTLNFSSQVESTLQENTNDSRFMRSMNAVFKYDFKVGNYMPDDVKQMNPHLFMTIKDITTGIKKSS